ncbi:MAG: bifunctional hydroxymethylpyrimidine kinase/phosphomethylpyrimidine kinase [Holophagales bacterium]|jgi:hydroxymethylpyrimidine/phosphomethylpyrimidine kinase|nr:bifunctional hydroxymethylpyrimidine kinase/phosphomethylpyrimidine kinase [Holophagales bacterium]
MSGFRPELPVALFLGGLDPSGGAGILRDVIVASALGIHSMAIPIAETVQNGIECAEIAPPSVVPLKRLNSLKPHLCGKWGAKLSMFHNCSALHDVLPQIHNLEPSVAIWDPIMAPSNGVGLHNPESLKEVIDLLVNNNWIVSPNMSEARQLVDLPNASPEDAAKKLIDMGIQSVWIRSGHSNDKTVQDLWHDENGSNWLTPYDRLDGDPRGTGCTVTAAWLALCLGGMEPIKAAEAAVQHIRKAWNYLHMPGGIGGLTFPPRVQ